MPPGTYWLGLEFESPTYDFPEDTSRLLAVQILDGTWMFRHAFQELGVEAVSVAAGDLDGDCDVDLIFRDCEMGDARNVVYWDNGDGTFGAGYSFREGPVEICNGSLRLGDLDRDGDLDLVESALFPPEFGEDCDGREGCPADCQSESNPAEVATVNGRGWSCSLGEPARHAGAASLWLLAAVGLALGRRPRGRAQAS